MRNELGRFVKGLIPHNKMKEKVCIIDGCDRGDMKAKGLCNKHYRNKKSREANGIFNSDLSKRLPRTQEDIDNQRATRIGRPNPFKGKTFEEIYGEVGAKKILDKMRIKKVSPKHKKLLNTWISMKRRCNNPDDKCFYLYGERGIKIQWESFEEFKRDMISSYQNEDLSIDRIDNDGNYSKENCRWATPIQQANNKRNNRFIEFNGERLTVAQWARKLNINYSTLYMGIFRYGLSIEYYSKIGGIH